MKILLIKEFEKLGKINDVVEIKDAYATNYIIPKKIGIVANKKNLAERDKKIQIKKNQNNALIIKANQLKTQLESIALSFDLHSFHSKLAHRVSNKKIAVQLEELHQIKIDKKSIILPLPLAKPGEFKVKIKLYGSIFAYLPVVINAIS